MTDATNVLHEELGYRVAGAATARFRSATSSNGAPLIANAERTGGRYCCYRWHGDNPVTFERSLKHTMEHGHANDRGDDFFWCAYWYQSEPFTDFPLLPAVAQRIPVVRPS